jgi:hypothetical protein
MSSKWKSRLRRPRDQTPFHTAFHLLTIVVVHVAAAVAAHALFNWPWHVVIIGCAFSLAASFILMLLYFLRLGGKRARIGGTWIGKHCPTLPPLGAPAANQLELEVYQFGWLIVGSLHCVTNRRRYHFSGVCQRDYVSLTYWIGDDQHSFELGTLVMKLSNDGMSLAGRSTTQVQGPLCLALGRCRFRRCRS